MRKTCPGCGEEISEAGTTATAVKEGNKYKIEQHCTSCESLVATVHDVDEEELRRRGINHPEG